MNLDFEMIKEARANWGEMPQPQIPWQTKVYQGTAIVALVISKATLLLVRDFREISESRVGLLRWFWR